MLVPATENDATPNSGEWVFVDIGFSRNSRSCGFAVGDSEPQEVVFGSLAPQILSVIGKGRGPLNLLIEAPLSVAFNAKGNPTGRRIEKRGYCTRYWYVGSGCTVLVATTYLLRELYEANSTRRVRLFEGFVSFKEQGASSFHTGDVAELRNIAWSRGQTPGRVVGPHELKAEKGDILCSAFAVSGMDLGVPPVVVVGNDVDGLLSTGS